MGDTHVHSYLSGDAFALGSGSRPRPLSFRERRNRAVDERPAGASQRPLDFLWWADHAANLGSCRSSRESCRIARDGERKQLGADHR